MCYVKYVSDSELPTYLLVINTNIFSNGNKLNLTVNVTDCNIDKITP